MTLYAASILDTVRQPFLLLSADLRVVTANPFYDLCRLTPAKVDDQLAYELGLARSPSSRAPRRDSPGSLVRGRRVA